MESLCRILGDVSDANIASWPVLTGQEVSIAKSKKKKNTTGRIGLPIGVFGDFGHSLRGPMGSLRNALSVFIELIKE
jgi:hypothetical protein